MRDVIEMLKKSVGLDDEPEESQETETIIVPEHSFYEIILLKAKTLRMWRMHCPRLLRSRTR